MALVVPTRAALCMHACIRVGALPHTPISAATLRTLLVAGSCCLSGSMVDGICALKPSKVAPHSPDSTHGMLLAPADTSFTSASPVTVGTPARHRTPDQLMEMK